MTRQAALSTKAAAAGRNIIPHFPMVCQVKNAKKIKKFFYPKSIDFFKIKCYNYIVNKKRRKKHLKKYLKIF
jgi:hypothetical protein